MVVMAILILVKVEESLILAGEVDKDRMGLR